MVRTRIQLTEAQAESLRALAIQQGCSLAELIRRAVDSMARSVVIADAAERRRRALAVAGRFTSGRSDVSAAHDCEFAESIGA